MKFIVIDGIDGSGKDTQSHFIYEKYRKSSNKQNLLQKENQTVFLRSHPELDNYFGKKAHYALLKNGKINKIIAGIFYIFDVIRSLILYYPKSDILIFSRYLLGIVYLPKSLVKPVYWVLSFILPTSEYMFFLDIPPKEAMKRISERNNGSTVDLQVFENEKSLKKCREKAFLIANDWEKINACEEKYKIREKIENILDNKTIKSNK